MRFAWSLAAATLLLLPALAPSSLAGSTQEASYTGAGTPFTPAPCEGSAKGLAGACFPMPANVEDVHLSVADEVNGPVAAEWRLEGSGGDVELGAGLFCGETWILEPDPEDFPVERVRVTVLAPGFAEQVCPLPGFGTEGTITATFETG